MSMDDDFKRDGMLSNIIRRLNLLENFEREYRLKKIGAGGGGAFLEGARVYNSAVQSIPDVTPTSLNFDRERWDTDNIHDNAINNTRLTCNTAGKYVIGGSVEFAASAVGYRFVGVLLNGGTYLCEQRFNATSSAGIYTGCSVMTIYDLAVGNYVELSVLQNTGGALNTVITGNTSVEFYMHHIG